VVLLVPEPKEPPPQDASDNASIPKPTIDVKFLMILA
jgi:hypothetical protein